MGAASMLGGVSRPASDAEGPSPGSTDWTAVREQFDLAPDRVHLSNHFLASHPRPVREAIERFRRELDADPTRYLFRQGSRLRRDVLTAAAEYFSASPAAIALTDSTTMGLALLYQGLPLDQRDEILTTEHDHYSTLTSVQLAAQRTGAVVRKVRLYRRPAEVSAESLTSAVLGAVTDATRVVALTWVHSDSGLKLPIRSIAEGLARVNRLRGPDGRALLCVDGLHGFGVEDADLQGVGCDFFVAGCHKWIYGPRGTGVVYAASPALWDRVLPMIPPFGLKDTPGLKRTPGGFHSFEHRWALAEAFRFHLRLGKARVAERVRQLATAVKDGLAEVRRVVLHTPRSPALSAGIISFDVEGMPAAAVVRRLQQRGVVVTRSPYGSRSVRVVPGIVNGEGDIDRFLEELRRIVRA